VSYEARTEDAGQEDPVVGRGRCFGPCSSTAWSAMRHSATIAAMAAVLLAASGCRRPPPGPPRTGTAASGRQVPSRRYLPGGR